jgi:hypothetical protein
MSGRGLVCAIVGYITIQYLHVDLVSLLDI